MLWSVRHPLRRTWFGEIWRAVVTLSLGFGIWGLQIWDDEQHHISRDGWYALDLLVGILTCFLLAGRRRWPLFIVIITTLATTVSAFAAAASTMAIISLAIHRQWRPLTVAALLWVGTGYTFTRLRPPPGGESLTDVATNAIVNVVLFGIATLIGSNLGAQRMLETSLRERAETAEREQAGRVLQAQTAERARIAREMHDVLAHRISTIAMHSGAMAYRSDLSREESTETAILIRDTSRQALAELREILGVLRSPDECADPTAPQPTLATLGDLLAHERQAGSFISADIAVSGADAIPGPLSRTVYRVVQECLTNARKHAPGQPVHLMLDGGPERGIHVVVRNRLAPVAQEAAWPSSGMGLAGLTERAMLAGGRLAHGPDGSGEFVVTAQLPWPQEEAKGA